MQKPLYCNQVAFDMFVSQIGCRETNIGICSAVTAIAMRFDRQVSLQLVALELGDIAKQVTKRVTSGSDRALIAHLHQVLFEGLGFRGDTGNFYNPKNSLLPNVLECKRGIPITLALLYKLVAGRCGLDVIGLNTAGYFLARLTIDNERMIVGGFFSGKLMSESEVYSRIRKMMGRQKIPEINSAVIEVATRRQWVTRLLANIIQALSIQNRPEDIAAVMSCTMR